MKEVKIKNIVIGGNNPLVLIAGPCVIESEELTLTVAHKVKSICEKIDIPYIFKTSYTKANRTSVDSYTGPGLKDGLKILEKVKKELDVPILTDVHCRYEVDEVAGIADIIQIPAFLCRQTELILTVGRTGKVVNIKKGQFIAPDDMGKIANKVKSTGNDNILLTERGTTFGYHNLVVDMRSLIIMSEFGYPVVFDATHSLQLPSSGEMSGGQPQFIIPLARSAVACGCNALFVETHPHPESALSDSSSMLNLNLLPELLKQIKDIDEIRMKYFGSPNQC